MSDHDDEDFDDPMYAANLVRVMQDGQDAIQNLSERLNTMQAVLGVALHALKLPLVVTEADLRVFCDRYVMQEDLLADGRHIFRVVPASETSATTH